jgi:hypothetical protein
VQGCGELAAEVRTARGATSGAREALAAVGEAYTAFARRRPALAVRRHVHTHTVDLPFATEEAPAALQEAFCTAW